MGKRKKRKVEVEQVEDPDELEGFVVDGTLFLRDDAAHVYSSERDDHGNLLLLGTWDAQAGEIVKLAPLPPKDDETEAAAAPSIPHPTPQPLSFATDEEDHCETAPLAYAHVAELLRATARSLGIEPAELRIYDPYYCNGAVARHLAALGFPRVHNANEDFYKVVAAGEVPSHDVLLTNPPCAARLPATFLPAIASGSVRLLRRVPCTPRRHAAQARCAGIVCRHEAHRAGRLSVRQHGIAQSTVRDRAASRVRHRGQG